MNRNKDITSTIRDLFEVIFRHKKKIIFFNLMIFLMTCAVVFYWPRKYRSEAKIWIKIGRENSKLDPTVVTGETIAIQETDREDEIKSVLDVIGARGVATATVTHLTPDVVLGDAPPPNQPEGDGEQYESGPLANAIKGIVGNAIGLIKSIDPVSPKEEAIEEIVENIKVDAQRKSNVIAIWYDAKTPALAQAVIQTMIDSYRHEHTRIHHTSGSTKFFDEQRAKLRERVANASERLKKVKDEIGISSIAGQRVIVEAEMLHVQTAKLDTISQISEADGLSAELTRLKSVHPEMITSEERSVPNTGRDTMEAQLYALSTNRMKLESKYTGDNPLVSAARFQEQAARKQLLENNTDQRDETAKAINPVHQEMSMKLAQTFASKQGYIAKLKELKKQEEDLRARVSNLNKFDIDVKSLERELALAERKYMTYEDNFEDARMDDELNKSLISNIGIAQQPTYQEKPVSPSKLLVGVMGIAAMMFGTAFILGLMQLLESGSVRQPRDLEETLAIPVMVSIPNQKRYLQVLR